MIHTYTHKQLYICTHGTDRHYPDCRTDLPFVYNNHQSFIDLSVTLSFHTC